jgi:hypothetical protein
LKFSGHCFIPDGCLIVEIVHIFSAVHSDDVRADVGGGPGFQPLLFISFTAMSWSGDPSPLLDKIYWI